MIGHLNNKRLLIILKNNNNKHYSNNKPAKFNRIISKVGIEAYNKIPIF